MSCHFFLPPLGKPRPDPFFRGALPLPGFNKTFFSPLLFFWKEKRRGALFSRVGSLNREKEGEPGPAAEGGGPQGEPCGREGGRRERAYQSSLLLSPPFAPLFPPSRKGEKKLEKREEGEEQSSEAFQSLFSKAPLIFPLPPSPPPLLPFPSFSLPSALSQALPSPPSNLRRITNQGQG